MSWFTRPCHELMSVTVGWSGMEKDVMAATRSAVQPRWKPMKSTSSLLKENFPGYKVMLVRVHVSRKSYCPRTCTCVVCP